MTLKRRHGDLLSGFALFLLALLTRCVSLNVFSTADEGTWFSASLSFLDALGRADWVGSLGSRPHPGITTQWLGALGIVADNLAHISFESSGIRISGAPLSKAYVSSLEHLAAARFPTAVLTALFVVALYVLFRRTLGTKTAAFVALIVAFDHFFVALSRLLSDNLHAIFALLAILCLGLGLKGENWRWHAGPGVCGGLAFLSKSPAVVLIPLVLAVDLVVRLLSPKNLVDGEGIWGVGRIVRSHGRLHFCPLAVHDAGFYWQAEAYWPQRLSGSPEGA
jgi:hypothetical protein